MATDEDLVMDEVLLVEFMVESGSIFIGLKSGQLISIGVSSFSPPSRYLHTFENKLSSIKLSPDQDLIAVADVNNTIYIMSIDCDILFISNALNQNNSLHKPVGVGWGSKETQFFGLDGRPSKEKQADDGIVLSDQELIAIKEIESSKRFIEFRQSQERNTVIDWRGDGQYIATLTYIPDSSKHYLKVWNRNLELQYMSEQLVTIERGLLCWIPNGQYVCCAQKRDQRINDIALFEKNGMVHQRMTLPTLLSKLTYTKTMAWSPDSKIFAIIVNQFEQSNNNSDYKSILILYTMQNFHYYLKYATDLECNANYQLKWDSINQNRLHVISSNGHYIDYNFTFEVTYSDEHSTVAVIDGNKIRLTPMEFCNIPPPMCALTIEIETSIIHSLVINPCEPSNIFIITLNNQLIITSPCNDNDKFKNNQPQMLKFYLENSKSNELYNKIQNFDVYKFQESQALQNYTPIDIDHIIATKSLSEGSQIIELKLLPNTEVETRVLKEIDSRQIVHVSRDNFNLKPKKLILFLDDNSSILFDISTGETEDLVITSSITAKSFFNYINVQTVKIKSNNSLGFISLTQDLTLRFNTKIIAPNCCSSFRITKNFLVYTITDNSLHFVLLENLYKEELSKDCIESWSQPIEIGGTLIIVAEKESKVILQMPRGNLEILHPRVLIFSLLTNLLDEEHFIEAIKLARRHRLNMNFLADYLLRFPDSSPSEMFHKFATVINSHDPPLLSLFITELEDVDTINVRYKSILEHLPKRKVDLNNISELSNQKDKTNHICQFLIESLTQPTYNYDALKPSLLCLLKSKPKKIGEGLRIVKELEKESQNEAMRFMLYFIDIDQLFNEALCTYDTDITLMVANASHKDPKEYLALLNEFDKIQDKSLRCFKIDMHVKRYSVALNHLINILKVTKNDDTERQVIELICSHKLYKDAISLLPSLTDFVFLIENIWSKYGEYLLLKKYYSEAGLAYSKALVSSQNEEHLLSALKCYSLINDWEKSLALVTRHKFISDSTKAKCIDKIRDQLLNDQHYYKLAYLLDINKLPQMEYVDYLTSKESWHLAEFYSNQCEQSKQRFLIHIVTILPEKAQEVLNELQGSLQATKQHFERLKPLIITYQSRKIVDYNGDNYISDGLSTIDGSETSSTASGSIVGKHTQSSVSSIKTRNSSKSNTSVMKQKRINLKVGSRHEDLGLIIEIQKYISEQKENQQRAMNLASALYDFCDYELAMNFTKQINEILLESYNLSKEISSLLWPLGPQYEQKYSLFKRFSDLLSKEDVPFENVDFQVLMRPNMANNLLCYEL